MINYLGNRYKERFEYIRVDWSTWKEHEAYPYITGGSLEFSTDSALKVTGSFDFEGMEIPNTNDPVRVYYTFTDDKGESIKIALATLFVGYNALTHTANFDRIKSKGQLNGTSMLAVLDNDKIGVPYTVKRNTNAIYEAQKIIKEHGLNVDFTPSITILDADQTFEAGKSYLEIVNWLLDLAGYNEATPNEYGTIELKPNSEDSITFTNDSESIMYPQIEVENSLADTPNVVRLLYNVEDACITAEAKNESGSRVSLDVTGGRENVYFEDIGELGANGSKLQALIDKAVEILQNESADVETVKMDSAYVPCKLYENVTINYGEMQWTGTLTNINLTLSTAVKTTLKVKKILTYNLVITKSGNIIRGA